MSKIRFRDPADRESEKGADEGQEQGNKSKPEGSLEATLEKALSSIIDKNASQATEPSQEDSLSAQSLLGLSDEQMQKLNGDETGGILISAISNLANATVQNDSIVLKEIDKIASGIKKSHEKSTKE